MENARVESGLPERVGLLLDEALLDGDIFANEDEDSPITQRERIALTESGFGYTVSRHNVQGLVNGSSMSLALGHVISEVEVEGHLYTQIAAKGMLQSA